MAASFSRRGDGMLSVTTEDGTPLTMPGYMAEHLSASGATEVPEGGAVAPVLAPPPDMGAPAVAPDPLAPSNLPVQPPIAASSVDPTLTPDQSAALQAVASTPPPQAAPPAPHVAPAPITPTAFADQLETVGVPQAIDPSELVSPGSMSQEPTPQESLPPAALALPPLPAATGGGGGGGLALAQRTEQRQAPLTGARREATDRALQGQFDAARGFVDAEQRALLVAQEERALKAERERAIAERRAVAVAELKKKRDDMQAAVPKEMDTTRWDKTGGLGRVLAVIASSIGGYAQGMNGGANVGLQMLENVTRDDIEVQKHEAAQAQDAADLADNTYQRALAAFGGDEFLAENQVKLDTFAKAEQVAQDRLNGAQDEVTKAGYTQMLADLRAKIEETRNVMDGKMGTVADQYAVPQGIDPLDQIIKQGQAAEAMRKIRGDTAGDPRTTKTYRESQVRLPARMGGGVAWAPDKETAAQTRALLSAHEQFSENMDRLDELAKTPFKSLTPADRAEAEAIVAQNIPIMRDIAELGAITDSDRDIIAPLSGMGIADVWTLDESKRRQRAQARRYVDRKVEGKSRDLYKDPELKTPLVTKTGKDRGAREVDSDTFADSAEK